MFSPSRGITLLAAVSFVQAHTVISYPGWRGDNIITNGTAPEYDPQAQVVMTDSNGTTTFPYGMQFAYPCGGMPTSENRTKWPVTGGAVAVQPGWFPGHYRAQFYINMGITEPGSAAPNNMTHNVVPPFELLGPSNDQYPGTWCLPQVPLPAGINFNVGDNLTIQVIELTQGGAALYNCVDITLADPQDPEITPVTTSNCFNSSTFGFGLIFSTASLSAAPLSITPPTILTATALAVLSAFALL